MTRDDEVYTHCSEALLVVRLPLLVRNLSHIELLFVHEDWPENVCAEWQRLESEASTARRGGPS